MASDDLRGGDRPKVSFCDAGRNPLEKPWVLPVQDVVKPMHTEGKSSQRGTKLLMKIEITFEIGDSAFAFSEINQMCLAQDWLTIRVRE